MSGYDIKKLIEMGLQHFWNESYGQLYPTLSQLVEEGLAKRKQGTGTGRRSRHVYSITTNGRRVLADWLREPTVTPSVRNEFLLKFFLTGRHDSSASIRLIEEFQDQERARLETFTMSEQVLRKALRQHIYPVELAELTGPPKEDSNQLLVFLLSLTHGIRLTEARLAWCEEALKSLQKHVRQMSAKERST